MSDRIRPGTWVALLALAVLPPAASATPASVNLRVEGSMTTLFDAPITTDGHEVTTPAGGTHKCDGTNGIPPANPSPVPSATAALDDGARLAGFGFDGPYNDGFDDFFITEIGGEQTNATKFWGFFVNSIAPEIGGCQQRVNQGDEVLWAYAAFGAAPLKLAGPTAATTGSPVTVRVTHGEKGTPEPGASVGGAVTGADGSADLRFDEAGVYRLKADRPDAIRSNTLVLCVDPPGADPCSSTDKAAPTLRVSLPGRFASDGGRSRTILVSWLGDDQAGSGVATYSAEVRKVADGAGASQATPEWRMLLDKAPATGVHFRGDSGDAYQFRVSAADRAANRSMVETEPVVIPVDDRDRGLLRFSRGWKRVRSNTAWGRTAMRADESGPSARLRFRGSAVALIGRKLANGGRLRVTVDGRRRLLRVRGRSPARSVLWTSDRRPGSHSLTIRSLGNGPVEVDAVAPVP
jgi:Domain of unknown function (DUF4430)